MRNIFYLFLFLYIISNLQAKIINIPADIDSIQGGIDMAIDGDTVLVQPGTYIENINIDGKKIIIGSLFLTTNNKSYISKTIIDGSYAKFDGDLPGNSVVTFIDNEDSTTVLCGFTITNGSGGYGCGAGCGFWGGGITCYNSNPTLLNLLITKNNGWTGGGMYLQNSNPKLIDVTIAYNNAYIGGGIHFGVVEWGWNSVSKPKFDSINRCNIYSNYATKGSDLYLENDSLLIDVIVDTFTVMQPTSFHAYPKENFDFDMLASKIEQSNSDLYVSTDGNDTNDGLTEDSPLKSISYAMMKIIADSLNPHKIYLANGEYIDTIIKNSPIGLPNYVSMIGESPTEVIFNADDFFNEAFWFYSVKSVALENLTIIGGRIISDNSDLIIKNVILKGTSFQSSLGSNTHIENVKIIDCGLSAISLFGSNATLINVEVADNSFESGTCALRLNDDSFVNMINCTISNNKNSSNWHGGIYLDNESLINIVNSIIWNNTPTNIAGYGNVWAFYSDIQGGWIGTGNLNADPMFVDPEHGDYRLQLGSSCINKGIQDTMIIYNNGQDTLFIPPMDYIGSAPDMGAYEFDPSTGINRKLDTQLQFALSQNYPNPFNPTTTIEFSIPEIEFVTLKIFNILGQEIVTLVSEKLNAGNYRYYWDASGFSNGIYFYRLESSNGFTQSRKLVLLR